MSTVAPSCPADDLAGEHVKVIEPTKGWLSLNLREVWRYRELLGLLVWRDTVVRYKQSIVGIGWAVIQPVTAMVIFSIIFGQLAKLPSDGVPYPIFTYVALLPWNYFARCLSGSSGSLVSGSHLVTKVYFPRLILPLSTLFAGLVDFAVSFVVLIGLMVWYRNQITISWGIAFIPLFLLLAMLTALAVGLWLTSLMVKYRDVQHLLPFLTQIWMYLTPVAYSASLIPAKWRLIYALNPVTGVIEGFRWALLGRSQPNWGAVAVSTAVTLLILVTGLYHFRRTEKTFVDII